VIAGTDAKHRFNTSIRSIDLLFFYGSNRWLNIREIFPATSPRLKLARDLHFLPHLFALAPSGSVFFSPVINSDRILFEIDVFPGYVSCLFSNRFSIFFYQVVIRLLTHQLISHSKNHLYQNERGPHRIQSVQPG
jgi:hypothetical protein